MPYTVVITGGRGFVGQHLIQELKQAWPDANIHMWDLPDVDITNPSTYEENLRNIQPDWVVHLAALAKVGESFKNSEQVHLVNVQGTETLLEKIIEVSPHTKVLAVSSSDIYGVAGSYPITELKLSQVKPVSPYAASKLAMEKIIEERFNDLCIRVRPFPHIGPGQNQGFVTSDFASQIAKIEKGSLKPVIKVGNLDAKRDFTDVRDVVKAYRLLMEKEETGEVYNIASGEATSIKVILNKLLALSSSHIEVKPDVEKMRVSDNPILVGDASKLKEAVGWQPLISLDESLRDILDYWRDIR